MLKFWHHHLSLRGKKIRYSFFDKDLFVLVDHFKVFIQKTFVVLHTSTVMCYAEIQTVKSTNQGMLFSISTIFLIDLSCFHRFTVHGFRYLQVSGSPNPLTVDDVECPVVHSETTLKGNFTSSNPIINQIQHNIQWGQLANIMSIPTDWYVCYGYVDTFI
jgi:hypothetical protein